MKKIAIIDLGTNTFTMLIAELLDNQQFNIIFHERYYIKLAENGIETIGTKPFQRALDALLNFKKSIDAHGVQLVRGLATEGFRKASNGQELIDEIYQNTQIKIDIIEGIAEANYIYEGVKYSYPFDNERNMIMDIGGGSCEFIICNQEKKIWAQSFPVGVAVLKNKFHVQEPITHNEIEAIEQYLEVQLQPLFQIIAQFPVTKMVGASGTFDVLERLFTIRRHNATACDIDVSQCLAYCERLIKSSLEERKAMQDLPDERIEMIVVALVLIRFVVTRLGIDTIGVTKYAMKEGLMAVISKGEANQSL
jgi:exopolyphosphatase / guanosine-5'-triphosphate,3'-diphosphate pyrophosphatase